MLIECACGCKNILEDKDSKGRLRRFIRGHNVKKDLQPDQPCSLCGKLFNLKGKQRGAKGLCQSCYNKQLRLKNIDGTRKRKREERRRFRLRFLEAYGKVCECCGESRPEFLGLDHVNNDGAQHRKEKTHYAIYKEAMANVDKSKFRILCHNCNFARGHYGYCPHERERNQVNPPSGTCEG